MRFALFTLAFIVAQFAIVYALRFGLHLAYPQATSDGLDFGAVMLYSVFGPLQIIPFAAKQ